MVIIAMAAAVVVVVVVVVVVAVVGLLWGWWWWWWWRWGGGGCGGHHGQNGNFESHSIITSSLGPIDCSESIKRLHSTICYMFRSQLHEAILSRLFAFRDAFVLRCPSSYESASNKFEALSTDLWTLNHSSRPLFGVKVCHVMT